MRRSSIGSPYVKAITGRNPSRFFSMACEASTPAMVFAALKSLSPKAFAAHGIPTSQYNLTARVFSCPATSGDLAVLTTCSIFRGGERVKLWTEFAMLSPSLVSAWRDTMEWKSLPDKSQAAQSYLVWTSQRTFAREVTHRLALSCDTSKQLQSVAVSAG